jgi:beta-lactamase class A
VTATALYVLTGCNSSAESAPPVRQQSADQPSAAPSLGDVEPPADLQSRLETVARKFGGKVGIAIRAVDDEWTAGFGAGRLFPQQEASRLWVALALFDTIDRGNTLATAEGVEDALQRNDRLATDRLIERAGGDEAVHAYLSRKQIDEVAVRPSDPATPDGLVRALARLQRGELLSLNSTARLIGSFSKADSPQGSIEAGLPPGWQFSRAVPLAELPRPINGEHHDIGLLRARDGRLFAVAVMTSGKGWTGPQRQRLSAMVTNELATWHTRTLSQRSPSTN